MWIHTKVNECAPGRKGGIGPVRRKGFQVWGEMEASRFTTLGTLQGGSTFVDWRVLGILVDEK